MSSKTEPFLGLGAMALITVIALAVRLPGLDGGLWIDEISALLLTFRPPVAALVSHFEGDIQHPLYALLAHLAIVVFGESPWAMRLPALLFGVATVPLLAIFARRYVARREALGAALLLAVAYHHVWFSQNARGYTAIAFWTLLGTHWLLRGLDTGARRDLLGYGVLMALAGYTHLTTVFVAATQGAVAWCALRVRRRSSSADAARASRRTERRLLGGLALGAALGLALYAPMLPEVVHYFRHRPSQLVAVSTPSWALLEMLRGLRLGTGTAAGLVVAAALAARGLVDFWRRTPLPVLLFAAPALTTVAGAALARGTLYPRFFFYLVAFAVVLLARGLGSAAELLARAARRPRTEPALFAALVAAAGVVSVLSLDRQWSLPKQDFAGPLTELDAHRAAGDIVATTDVTSLVYEPYFGRDWPAVEDETRLAALRRGHRVWLVYTFPRYLANRSPALAERVDRECEPAGLYPGTVGDGAVRVCSFAPLGGEESP